jgi:uncharacterized protein
LNSGKDRLWHAYTRAVDGLLTHDAVQSMKAYRHHYFVNCYEHSVSVSYVAFRMARALRMDASAAARGGLLHDLYLYDADDLALKKWAAALHHPAVALENAENVCALSDKERNIILAHMWPVATAMPRSGEAAVVCAADKVCAVLELCKIWHRMKMARRIRAA